MAGKPEAGMAVDAGSDERAGAVRGREEAARVGRALRSGMLTGTLMHGRAR